MLAIIYTTPTVEEEQFCVQLEQLNFLNQHCRDCGSQYNMTHSLVVEKDVTQFTTHSDIYLFVIIFIFT